MNQNTEAVAGAVRAAMAEHLVDVDTLAGWLGVSRSTASKKRHGKIPFSVAELWEIASQLDLEALAVYPDVIFAAKRSLYREPTTESKRSA